jgi:hypothetical protein
MAKVRSEQYIENRTGGRVEDTSLDDWQASDVDLRGDWLYASLHLETELGEIITYTKWKPQRRLSFRYRITSAAELWVNQS